MTTRWLTPEEQRAWRAYVAASALLEDTLKLVFRCQPVIEVEQLTASAVMVIELGRSMNQTEALMVAPEIGQVFRVIGIVVGCEIDLDFKSR